MKTRFWLWLVCLAVFPGAMASAQTTGPVPSNFQTYQTKYYDIHTDVDGDDLREAALRMTYMAEEYHKRTAEFTTQIPSRMPFYLFRKQEDYLSAGGLPGTAGVFTGSCLMAIFGDKADAETWHVIQHEGFHQFAASTIHGELPIWLNEGLAEYFGYAIFTGDQYLSGGIPPLQLRMVRAELQAEKKGINEFGFYPVPEIMAMSHEQWNAEMRGANYDQAWSMVQFLAHGDEGKYQKAFTAALVECSHGQMWDKSFRDQFGDLAGFEPRWRTYWTGLPPAPTDQLFAQGTVLTLVDFLGRAALKNQTFANFDEFLTALDNATIAIPAQDPDWLPLGLGQRAALIAHERIKAGFRFTIQGVRNNQIACVMPDGTRLVATFTIVRQHVAPATVTVSPTRH